MSTGCFRPAIRLQGKVIPSSRRIMMQFITARWYGDLATNYMHPLRYRVSKGRPYGCADECQAGRPCFAILLVLLDGKTAPKEPSVWESTAVRSMLRHPPPRRAGGVLLVLRALHGYDRVRPVALCRPNCHRHPSVHGAHASPRRPRRSENPYKNPRRGRISTAPRRRWMPFG